MTPVQNWKLFKNLKYKDRYFFLSMSVMFLSLFVLCLCFDSKWYMTVCTGFVGTVHGLYSYICFKKKVI